MLDRFRKTQPDAVAGMTLANDQMMQAVWNYFIQQAEQQAKPFYESSRLLNQRIAAHKKALNKLPWWAQWLRKQMGLQQPLDDLEVMARRFKAAGDAMADTNRQQVVQALEACGAQMQLNASGLEPEARADWLQAASFVQGMQHVFLDTQQRKLDNE